MRRPVVWKQSERCLTCGALDSYVTVKTRRLSAFLKRLRHCKQCGVVVEERQRFDRTATTPA
jgi:transcription elongation factor Elf1